MKEIKRYEGVLVDGVPAHRPSESGRWVKHEDLSALQEQVRVLSAENAYLKAGISKAISVINSSVFDYWEDRGRCLDSLFNIQTPYTDAAICEIRAQGVDHFAKHLRSHKQEEPLLGLLVMCAEEFAARIRAGDKS